MNRWGALVALLLAVAGALALRLPQLDVRPLHNDEAVNAIKVSELWQHGKYRYDPDEFHGPTLHYFSLPFLWLSETRNANELNEATLRLAPVTFGVALILVLLLFADGLGRQAIVWAAVFIAVSPAMVFYSRYFIHEMLLVFFTALALGAGWQYCRTGLARWAVVAGLGVGLMWATKETFVISVGAATVALVVTLVWIFVRTGSRPLDYFYPPPAIEPLRGTIEIRLKLEWKHLFLAMLAAFLMWLVFFSSFFTNWQGLPDSILTYLPWLKRAGGASPHIHPWSFYLERLAWFHPAKSPVWSEALILVLAAIGFGVSLCGKKSPLHFFLAIYTLTLTAAYALISYKTPWCLLSFYHGMILLAGVGAASLVEFCRARAAKVIVLAILAAATLQLTWQSWRASFVYFADRKNPYCYSQTVRDVLNLVQKAEAVAQVSPQKFATVVKVIAPDSDYGPLPWYLRRFQHVGWYDALPADPFAPIIVVSSKLDARLDEKSDKKWILAGMFEQRPAVFLELYVELELWKKYVATLPREPE